MLPTAKVFDIKNGNTEEGRHKGHEKHQYVSVYFFQITVLDVGINDVDREASHATPIRAPWDICCPKGQEFRQFHGLFHVTSHVIILKPRCEPRKTSNVNKI